MWIALLLGLAASSCRAELGDVPIVLRDKVAKGMGDINLLKDINSTDLASYFNANGNLALAVDLNEDLQGNESKDSIGVAIKEMSLLIRTTAGTFKFTDFFTSTTAKILESGTAVAQQFYTLFGRSGSAQLSGSGITSGYDDVVQIRNVAFSGAILGATLHVSLLSTAKTGTEGNETFFDYSDGFEDFAIIGRKQAATLEAANIGVDGASSTIAFSQTAAPGTPAPPLGMLLLAAAFVLLRSRTDRG